MDYEDEVDFEPGPRKAATSTAVESPEPFHFLGHEKYSQRLEDARALRRSLAAISESELKALDGIMEVTTKSHVDNYLSFLERCAALACKYNVVTYDSSALRKMTSVASKGSRKTHILGPLVFRRRLPIPRSEKMTVIEVQYPLGPSSHKYKVSAVTPVLPEEAEALVVEARKDFDYLEVWWVPNDVFVEAIREPDPIVVGVVNHPFADRAPATFSIFKWVDTVVESAYWSAEAY